MLPCSVAGPAGYAAALSGADADEDAFFQPLEPGRGGLEVGRFADGGFEAVPVSSLLRDFAEWRPDPASGDRVGTPSFVTSLR